MSKHDIMFKILLGFSALLVIAAVDFGWAVWKDIRRERAEK